MRNNDFIATYADPKIWTGHDRTEAETSKPRLRQINFINSAAAVLGMPSYAANTRTLD